MYVRREEEVRKRVDVWERVPMLWSLDKGWRSHAGWPFLSLVCQDVLTVIQQCVYVCVRVISLKWFLQDPQVHVLYVLYVLYMCVCKVISALKQPGGVKGDLSREREEGVPMVTMMTTVQPLSSCFYSLSLSISLPFSVELSLLFSFSLSHSSAVAHPSSRTLNWK